MKFLIDAQLPQRLAVHLRQEGFEAIHTLELPLGNKTPDAFINELSLREQFVVVTKDADFVDSFFIHGKPWKLLLISTGNVRNSELEVLFRVNAKMMIDGLAIFDFIEMNRTSVIFHQ